MHAPLEGRVLENGRLFHASLSGEKHQAEQMEVDGLTSSSLEGGGGNRGGEEEGTGEGRRKGRW